MLCKHAVAPKFNSSVHQSENYVLALLSNHRDMFHLDNELTTTKVCSCLFACTSQSCCPGRNEFPFHNQPTLPGVITQRDFQHCFFPLAIKARRTPNLANRKSLN